MQSKTLLITIISLTLLSYTNSQSLSTSCFSGQYYSSSTGKCQQCDISCAQCTTSDGCSLCYDQMYLTPVGNKVLCGYCYDILAGCTVCSAAYKCARCSNGFFLMSNATCANCSNLTANCALCYQNSTTSQLYCSACSDPYVLVEGACVQNPIASQIQASRDAIITGETTGSTTPSTSTASNKVTTGYTLKPSQTQSTSINQIVSTTSNQVNPSSSTSQTIICDINFILVGSVCIRIIPFCTQYDTTSQKCDVCVPSYSKSNGYCIPDILLLSTQSTTQQTTQNTQTNQVPSTTSTTQNNSSSSQTTSNSESKTCPEGQYLWFGACIVPGTQCTNRDSNNKCTNCIKGYTLNNGLCIQQIPPSSTTTTSDSKTSTNSSDNKNSDNSGNEATKTSGSNTASVTVVTSLNQMIEVLASGCTSPCATCKRGDLNYCVTCITGMTIVDAYPGICFNQN